jgi:serine/threonine-protein kinase
MKSPTSDPIVGFRVHRRYLATQLVSRGADLAVYRVDDEHMNRPAWLCLYTGPDAARRAQHLAVAASVQRIGHPNLEKVLAYGESPEGAYVVTERGEGRTLADELARGLTFTPNRAFAYLEPVVTGLAAAHAAGLAHGSLAAEHVFLADDGRIEVTGWGRKPARPADTRADVLAFGRLMLELLSSTADEPGGQDGQSEQRSTPTQPGYLRVLLARATAPQPGARPGDARELLPWVRSVAEALLDGVDDDAELEAQISGPGATATAPGRLADLPIVPSQRPDEGLAHDPEPGPDQPPAPELPRQQRPTAPAAPSGTGATLAVARTVDAPEGIRTGPTRRRVTPWRIALVVALVAGVWGIWAALSPGDQATTAVSVEPPEVLGMTVSQARQALQGAGLRAEVSATEYSDTVPRGQVLEVVAPPGALAVGDTLALVVSRGQERPRLPDLAGLDLADAKRVLSESGFKTGAIIEVLGIDVPAGQVVATVPAAGSRLDRGATIGISISRGTATYDVPDFRNWRLGDARVAARRFGLTITVVGREDLPGLRRILTQSPAPGSTITGGGVLEVVLSR